MSSHVIRQFFTLRIVLRSPARRGSFFFRSLLPPILPVRNVTGSIKSAEHYLSLTLCLSRKKREEKKRFRHARGICSPERLQHSAFNSWSRPQSSQKKLFLSTKTGFSVLCGFFFRRRTLRETDFSLPAKHLPSGADV